MIKDDLIFHWQDAEGSFGVKVFAFVLVAIVFTGFFGLIDVRLKAPLTPNFQSATVIHFADEEMARAWTLMAEEAGPFPGRLKIDGLAGALDMQANGLSTGDKEWSGYDISLRGFQEDPGQILGSLAPKGQRVFPERVKIRSEEEQISRETLKEKPLVVPRKAILTPFDSDAMKWIVDPMPDFEVPVDGAEVPPASLRFMLRLRPDGSVQDCISLGGIGEAGSDKISAWLGDLKFKPAAGERWLGLRVELINK